MSMTEPVRGLESLPEQLTIQALQAALGRCMTAHPPEGRELRLHRDADRMAGVLGLMIYHHVESIPMVDVEQTACEALQRWTV